MESELIHYVYRISNIVENKHYYGSRSSKCSPKDDLSINYFSSAKDLNFKSDQLENPSHYKYKIISIHKTRKEAIQKEIRLHNKFDVGINPHFYNRAKQSTIGFDTTGKIMVKGDNDNYIMINKNDPKYLSGEYEPAKIGFCRPGREFSDQHRENLSKSLKGKPKSKEHSQKIKESCNNSGVNHPRHKYMYVTPIGTFDSPAAIEDKLSLTKMKSFCIKCDRLVTPVVFKNSSLLQELFSEYENIKGKTYREIGFHTL